MSFYGTIYKQISNAFDRFFVKNSGKNKKDFLDSPKSSVEIKADGREGYLDFDSGNRWIQMEGNYTNNFCKIYHAQADTTNSDLSPQILMEVASQDDYDNNKEQSKIEIILDNDKYFKLNGIKYDKAGHVAGTEEQYLKFKNLDIVGQVQDIEGKFTKFTDEVEKRMTTAENTVKEYDDRVEALEDLNIKQKLDTLNKAVGSKSDFTNKEAVTLCNGVGNIDLLRNGGKDEDDVLKLPDTFDDLNRSEGTICDYINVLYAESMRNASVANKVIELLSRVDELERKVK